MIMTVEELIKCLEDFPKDARVILCGGYEEVTAIEDQFYETYNEIVLI